MTRGCPVTNYKYKGLRARCTLGVLHFPMVASPAANTANNVTESTFSLVWKVSQEVTTLVAQLRALTLMRSWRQVAVSSALARRADHPNDPPNKCM